MPTCEGILNEERRETCSRYQMPSAVARSQMFSGVVVGVAVGLRGVWTILKPTL